MQSSQTRSRRLPLHTSWSHDCVWSHRRLGVEIKGGGSSRTRTANKRTIGLHLRLHSHRQDRSRHPPSRRLDSDHTAQWKRKIGSDGIDHNTNPRLKKDDTERWQDIGRNARTSSESRASSGLAPSDSRKRDGVMLYHLDELVPSRLLTQRTIDLLNATAEAKTDVRKVSQSFRYDDVNDLHLCSEPTATSPSDVRQMTRYEIISCRAPCPSTALTQRIFDFVKATGDARTTLRPPRDSDRQIAKGMPCCHHNGNESHPCTGYNTVSCLSPAALGPSTRLWR